MRNSGDPAACGRLGNRGREGGIHAFAERTQCADRQNSQLRIPYGNQPMARLPSGKRVRSPWLKYHIEAMVRGPRRPIYMIRMESSLLASDKPAVMPVDRPTVPKALTT